MFSLYNSDQGQVMKTPELSVSLEVVLQSSGWGLKRSAVQSSGTGRFLFWASNQGLSQAAPLHQSRNEI